jgi:histone-lysine N-methyltransferase SETMAR
LATKDLAVASQQRSVSHFLFPRELLTKNMTVVPHKPYSPDLVPCDFSLFPRLKIKLKGCCFDTTEVIEAESQAVLNTLTEQDFQDAFKKWQKR